MPKAYMMNGWKNMSDMMDCLKDCNGACCKWVFIPAKEPEELEQLKLWEMRGCFFKDGLLLIRQICPRLKDGKCSIHGRKPAACKDYKPGCFDCLKAREAEGFKD